MKPRYDFLKDRKDLHVKMDKDVYTQFRIKAYHYGIYMQEMIGEFARLVGNDDPRVKKIIEDILVQKTKAALEGKPKKQPAPKSELEADMLYGLIDEEESDKKEGDSK